MLIKRRIAIGIIVGCMAAVLMLCGYAIWRERHTVPPYTQRAPAEQAAEQPPVEAADPAQPETSAAETTDTAPSGGEASGSGAAGGNAQTSQTAQTAQPQESGAAGGNAQTSQTAQTAQPQESGAAAETAKQPDSPTPDEGKSVPQEEQPLSAQDAIIAKYRARFDALAETYYADVEALAQGARDEYRALPKEEQTEQSRDRIVSERMGRLQELERSCDRDVDALLEGLANELTEIGADMDAVKAFESEYEQSKTDLENRYIEQLRNTNKSASAS